MPYNRADVTQKEDCNYRANRTLIAAPSRQRYALRQVRDAADRKGQKVVKTADRCPIVLGTLFDFSGLRTLYVHYWPANKKYSDAPSKTHITLD